MVLISYDISDDKKRARFNKYIQKFGSRLQYSVYQIDNSDRILNNIMDDIDSRFKKSFDENDSVYIFKMNESSEVIRYGYCAHDDADLLIVQ